MRINYTMTGVGKTGGSYVILEIVKGLIKRGHLVTITSNWGEKAEGVEIIKPYKLIDIIEEPIYKSKSILARALVKGMWILSKKYIVYTRKVRYLKNAIPECDINVATDCFSAYPVAESEKGKKYYHMQHYEPIFFDDPILRKLSEDTYKFPLNKIVNSIWLRNQMRERYGAEAPIINPAINHDSFYPRQIKSDKTKKIIVSYGRADDWKGFKDALAAMKIVFNERRDIEWFVFGFPGLLEDHLAPYKHLGYLNHEELAKLYSKADVFFLSSWYESFPLHPLEAMACACPVVTSRYGTEDYCIDRKNSMVVQPKDPQAMAKAILELLENDALSNQFRQNGLLTAKEFTWDKTVDRVEKLFQNKQI